MDTKVYIFQEIDHFSDADLEAAYSLVSRQRRVKAQEYVRTVDRKLSVIAALLLRYALAQESIDLDQQPEIEFGYHGKPHFPVLCEDGPLVHFNLSHCVEAVACAVSDAEIGVDVEPYSSYDVEVAKVVFNPEEQSRALGSVQNFAELWTKKESYLKLTGEGLSDDLPSLLTHVTEVEFATYHSHFRGSKGYACTGCAAALPKEFNPIIVDKTKLLYG